MAVSRQYAATRVMKQPKRASINSALAHCSSFCWNGNASVACRCTAKPTAGMVSSQVFKADALRHPAAADTFVPNDVQLGGGQAPFILLTGETPTTCLHYTLFLLCCLPDATGLLATMNY